MTDQERRDSVRVTCMEVILLAGTVQCPEHEILNPLLTNGFTHHYHLGESTLIFRGFRCDIKILHHFSMKFLQANRPKWDAAFCGITSEAMLFACVPLKGCQAYMS